MAVERVGVREVRQNLSRYLKRVEAGETFEVTEHGRPVALLSPVAARRRPALDRLAASGWVVLGSGENLAELGAPPAAGEGPSASEILDELRKDDR